jgi:tryptophan-rich sensory protein
MPNQRKHSRCKEAFKSLSVLLLSFLVTFAAGAVGALASISAQKTYVMIQQPSWAPPAWIFGPVWTSLYVLMALAAWLVWRQRERMRIDIALIVYIVHLIVQAIWSWLFFGIGRADLAMLDIIILGTMIAWLTFVFWRVDRLAGIFFIPYLLWVTFAAILNATLWYLNGGKLPMQMQP